jgi:uncharacterized repeat protein (TIGR01451 family)/gliding motility-associated-like protein
MIKQFTFLLILMLPTAIISGQEEYIAISKTGPSNAIPGNLISYTITVGNGDQNEWTGTIIDTLPTEFTYYSSDPAATTMVDQILTWSVFSVLSGQNRVITVTGYAGRLGSTFASPRYENGYYMENSNVLSSITNSIHLEHGTSGSTLSDSYSTDVYQLCDFYLGTLTGQIKMSTNATMKYLVVIQNFGNVWDKFSLDVDPDNPEHASCENPDGSPNTNNVILYNAILDLDDNPITETPWIAPGETYSLYLQLTSPPGTPANRWNCTDMMVTSELCGGVETVTYHTATINPPNEPNLYLFNIDYPDPVACEDILNYTVYITNLGNRESHNTIIIEKYDPFFEFISSDPLPDPGLDNTWSLGNIPVNGVAKIDIQGRIRAGVVNQQQIIDSVIVSYDNGASSPTFFADTIETITGVNAYPDLAIEKTASSSLVRLEDTITYTVNYYNLGCGTGTQVIIEDDYDELRMIITDNGGGTVADGRLTFDIGTLSPEQGVQTLEYSVVVTDVDCGAAQIVNDIAIASFEPDQDIINNSASTSVLATTVPSWISFPSDTTVECDDVPAIAIIGELEDVWAEDACARNVSILYLGETRTEGDCDDSYTLNRSWRAEDEDGNFSERSQLVTVVDTTAPVFTCPSFSGYSTSINEVGEMSVNLEANTGNNYLVSNTEFNAIASDNCDGSPVIAYTLSGSTTGSGTDLYGVTFNTGTTEVSWITTDRCGNEDTCGYTVIVNADPSIMLSKILTDIDGDPAVTNYITVGSELNYSFSIENTGNMTLYNVNVTDPYVTLTGSTLPELAPGELNDTSFTGTYIITQTDLDRGFFTNIASVSGTAINTILTSDSDTVTVAATQNSSMDLTKTSTTNPNTYSTVDDVLTYDLLISNSGNVTLSDITVVDSLTSEQWLITTLSPGGSRLFHTSYHIQQEDLDAGSIVNSASAEGTDPNGAPIYGSDDEIINANQLFTLVVSKTMDIVDYVYAGDAISYQIVLENTGNVNLLNISVEDVLSESTSFIDANQGGSYNAISNTVSWSIGLLSPAETLTIDLRVLVNQAVGNESVISNIAVAESVQTNLVQSNQTNIIALQMPEIQTVSVGHVNCYGEQTGRISVDVTGGLAPYTITWQHDASQLGWEVTGLPGGTYFVMLEDALGNTDDLSITIEEPEGPLSGTLYASDVLCAGESTGMIALDVNGGTPPYTFMWSNFATTQDIDGLFAGTYSVIVTDNNGCTWAGVVDIDEPEDMLSIFNVVIEDVICMDDPSGSISYDIIGGTTPYEYLWSNNETTQSLFDIPGGDYSLTVSDANGCQLQEDFVVDYQYENCEIQIPGGLTPYGEFDKRFIINGLEKYPDNSLRIFNRYGTMVYEANPYQNNWDGEPNLNHSLSDADGKLPSGTYFYILVFKPGNEPMSGYIYLIKD